MMQLGLIGFVLIGVLGVGWCEKVLMTEVFAIPIEPSLFNWTFEGVNEQFTYQPSLLNAPDLPKWINYVYSARHHAGYIFGVPPNVNNKRIDVDIIGLNRLSYETRRYILTIQIMEKLNPAKYEVQMKIDNLNVEDMFDVERMDRLKDIFRKRLWRDSQSDLYVTFLASAVKLGARLPLNPIEGEGVVIRIGSTVPLSNELIELQEEVKPLWKVPACPRDFKRTSVERLFRENGFALDWCTFRLMEDKSDNEELINNRSDEVSDGHWTSLAKSEVPQRDYSAEVALTVSVSLCIFIALATILTLILCVEHDELTDRPSEEYFESLFHICIDSYREKFIEEAVLDTLPEELSSKPRYTLNSLAHQNDVNYLAANAMCAQNHVGSPTGVHCRPSPPPYVKPKRKPVI